MTLSASFYSPYSPETGYNRGGLLYDPRGDSSPYLYGNGATYVWRLNRRTGVITPYHGQFDPQGGSFGPADMDENGNMWWIGDESNNLTAARQAQTKFAADTLAKIGSMTSNGTTIVYPQAGQVRVDRHSTHHLVWQLDQADIHSGHGNLYAWDGNTRIQSYFLARTTWDDHPSGGIRNRVWDLDPDADGNLWCVSIDDTATYVFLWKVTPAGVQTLVTDLSANFSDKTAPIMIKWVLADNTLVLGGLNNLVKCRVSDGAVIGTAATPIPLQYGQNYQSFHHTIDSIHFLYLALAGATGPIFYEINLLTLATTRTIDFAGVPGCVGVYFDGFAQANHVSQPFQPITALYDPVLGGVWCEYFFQGTVGAFAFDDHVQTTQLLAQVVIRPHAETSPAPAPPPVYFDTNFVLQQLTGPAEPMEICSGYVGDPAVLSQLLQVRAQYTIELAPQSSELHCFYTKQIGQPDVRGEDGVLNRDDWFNMRQTNRFHRVCLVCTGETEVVGLTWSLREVGIR